ncbi:hypothetical protein Ahy_A04g021047 [Arachis hypogaea]|uniref:Uncharacterized protein n=1 Tax=Arachis hypogaea TaxID=3818 RepID=A0A445DJ67_ARAHY|nr:hypothetical protein Ahy_A04g021047 [Arachis hypogaea]
MNRSNPVRPVRTNCLSFKIFQNVEDGVRTSFLKEKNQFGVAPRKSDCRASCIKLTWLRDLKERIQLVDETSMQRYVKCHIMLLFGTVLFGDKSGTSVHWKFLPLLRDFGSI